MTTPPPDLQSTLKDNLGAIKQRITTACQRVERSAESVSLVAVTKYAEWPWVQALSKLHHQFGENRPQQLIERQQQIPDIDWHLIGQLQRNKVKSVLPFCGLIHSVDSGKLFHKIVNVATELKRTARILIQVNVSGEDSKSGFSPQELRDAWTELSSVSHHISIEGLMTMAPASQDPEEARSTFAGLKKLRDELRADHGLGDDCLSELSMGMSGDFEVAIEEGATIVRVGSALYRGL